MQLPFVIGIEGPSDQVHQGVAGAWEMHSVEGESMPESPFPVVNGLHAEGGGQAIVLLADIHNCSHFVREQMNVLGSNEGQEHLTGKAGGPTIQR